MNTNRNVSNAAARPNVLRGAAFAFTFFCLTIVATSLTAATTYTWIGAGSTPWTTASNWSPSRTSPASDDILVFNNGATTTATGVITQPIGKLLVSANTAVTLQPLAATAAVVTIGGGAGALSVASGSQLNITGGQTAAPAANLSLSLATLSTGTIAGSMTLTTAAHRLTAADASGITFQNGSVFTSGTSFSGNPFGTTSLNSVIFASGSQYVAVAGSNPFGAATPSSVVIFQTGSLYKNAGGGPAFSGRTYANFEQSSGTATVTGGSAVVMDNLTVSGGTLNFNMTGTPGHTINGNIAVTGGTLNFNPLTAATVNLKGNISVSSGATLGFNPTLTGDVFNFNGTSAQTITNAGTINALTVFETLTVANANGVTLSSGTLPLGAGTITTGANTFAVASAASLTRTTGYVIGNLKKTFAATGSKTFEVGTANGYSPITANATAGTLPADLTISATQSAQPSMPAGKSILRYWTLTATALTADLTFQYLAGDVQGTEANYTVYRVSGGVPTPFPASVVTPATHSATLAGVSSFSDWTVGEAPDTTPPSVISVAVPPNGTYGTGQNLDFTINFSENVIVAGTPRIPITLNTGGTVYANYVSGTGTSALLFRYVVAAGNADPDGISVASAFDTNGGSVKDGAGNDAVTTLNSVGNTTGVLVDAIAPASTSSTVPADSVYGAGAALDFTVTFSKSVTVTGNPYVGVSLNTGGAVESSYFSGSGTPTLTFRYIVASGNADPDGITVDSSITLNGGTIKDGVGNDAALGVTFASTAGVLVDGIAPSVTGSTVPSNGTHITAQTLDYSVTFSEPVFVIGTPSVPVTLNTGGTVQANYVSGSGSATLLFRYTIVSGNADNDGVTTGSSIALNGGSIKDGAGNNAAVAVTFASTAGVLVDGIAPTVTSSVRADADPTNASTLHYTVVFSEDVSGVTTSAFALTAGGGASGSITGVVPVDAHTYTVTVGSAAGEGTLRLDVNASGTGITDLPGNPLNGGFTTGQFYTLDHVGPNITSVAVPPATTYTTGQNLDFTVNFNESANVASGTPRIALTLNSGTVYADYVSGSGGTALLFRHTVVSGDSDPDGIVVAGSIDLNGATIRDALGNDGNTTLNSVGSTTGVLVDANAPAVQSVTRANSNPTNAASVDFTVTFSQGVTGVDASDFALTTTGVSSPSITNVAGSGASYTVSVATGTGDGTIRLDVSNNGSILSATNSAPLGAAFTTGEVYTIDRSAPSVVSINRSGPSPTNASNIDFTVTFSESVTGVASNDFALVMSGVSGATIANVAGSGSTYTVTVNTGSGDGTLHLDFLGSAADSAGNATSGAFTSGQTYAIDKTPPTVQSITRVGAATTNATSVQFTVTYSEPVTGVSAQDWSLTTSGVTGASVTGFTGSGTTYTVTVNTGSGDGSIRLNVVTGGTVIDFAGNLLATGFTSGDVDTIDKTLPAVQSIVKASTDPATATSVDFTVTFTESVTGVDATDFTITAPALTGTSVSNVTGSGTTYTVTVATGNGSGSLRLDLTGNGTVIDAAGNSAASYTGGPSYTIQGLPSAPTSLVASAGDSHVLLTWNAVSGAATYTVKRSLTSGTGYTNLATGVAVTNYDDTSAINGTPYFYKVSATNGRGEGPDSSEATATPAPAGPAPGPVSIAVGDAKVILSWPVVAGATSYNVKRGTTTGSYSVTTNTLVPTFTDSTVTNGITYYYVVTALSPAESAASAEVSGTPNTPSVLGVVFSTVYGGGGNAGATLKNDYMELFNRGTQTVSLAGWSVQYTSAAATTWTAANSPTALSGTIAPGHYYLVQEGPGAGGSVNLPTPDASGLIAMGATAGKVALVGNTTGLTGACPTGTFIADFVGYGPTATCSETSPTAVLSNTTAALRNNNGCTDTNNNNSDFTVGAPNPRNSSSPVNVCGAVNNPPGITPPANPIASVAQDAAPFTVNLTGSDDGGVYQWTATPGTGLQSVSVTGGQGTANVTYTVTLTAGFSGTATFTATLSDGINTPVNQAVNIQVTGTGGNNPPLITPPANPITTVAQDPAPFTVNVSGTDDGGIFNWSATPGTGVASVNVTGGQGTATVTYTVTLNAGFNGTATFTASLSDNVNPTANQAVNINVLPAGATPNHVVISQLYGGGGNSGATYTNDFIELFNPTASPVSLAGWSVQYSSATNTGAFSGLQPIGGTIGPGEYYLISLASGGAVGSPLPTANVVNNSGINMSGTTGKVALVSTGTPVPGPCSATAADTDIVDLVGYGTTANCNEGGTNASAPSNTTSDFRKNGGNTDTNVNGNDFLTGTPNPRRTTPIQEFGPAIVNTDPASNASAAPRDASVIITFTELVDVDPGWYNINCSVTGNHNDATFVEGAPDTWVITPNANFSPAEQCSVTIFKNSVHDRDTDDSAPGTDTLAADYTWTFTVSSGAAPPYPATVHLTMGTPSVCTTSLSSPNSYLMLKPEMSICYNRDLGRPNWVSWHLTDEWFGSLARVDTFRPDPEVPPTWYRVLASDFFASGFDRGHMTPNADRDSQVPIVQATFLMSNMVAQAPDNNQGPWANLENDLRTAAGSTNELYIVSGPNGTGGTGSNGGVTNTVANGHVTVPASTWKCALVLPKASGDDVARVTASTRTICVIMPNIQGIRNDDWHIYLKSVDQVEALTGYDLFSNVPQAIQNAIEAGVDGANPPGAADQSTSTNEDVQKSITLDAATPGGALTYTILTGPFHGGLTGTGANRTYTPTPDFNGTDTFTWRVNDGTNNSNTATMTITVAEVNDPPVAVNDSKSTTSNSALTFASSDLTTNDSAGPANEAGQILTVTSVTSTASTHGTVVLNSGQITYTPAAGYTGPASFTYSVCDNGTTAGSAASLCTTATVNVTVNPAPPATHFSVTAPANVTNGAAFNVTVTALDASNATATGYTGTVHFTSSSTGTLPSDYTFTAGDLGAHTFSVTLTSNGSRTITATDTVTNTINGTATTNVLSTATHYSVTAPASTMAGTPFNVTVTALDASNAVVTSYTGTTHFTSSSAGTLPANYTFVSGDNGTHTFSVTLTATGTQTITATDTVTASITGTATTSSSLVCPPGPPPSVTASNSGPACAGHSVNLFASPSGATYSWTGPGGFTSAQQNPTGLTVAGTYTVTLSYPGPCGGSAQSSTTVVFNDTPVATIASAASTCSLSSGNNASVANAGAGATYTWLITNGTITSGAGTRAIVYTAGASGNVHLGVTVTNASGCTGTASADIAISSAPAITVQPTGQIVNPGNNATFTVTATGLNLHYQWFVRHPSGSTLPVGTDSSSYTTNPEGNAWWFVRVTNSCGSVDSVSVDALVVTPRHRPNH
jgi:DNA/RNA endonuclease G (NUC1)